MNTIKKQVGFVLDRYPETRNSDNKLIWILGQEFYGWTNFINYADIARMGSLETIVRYRRGYQRQGMYQSAKQVMKARQEKENFMRTNM